MPSESDRQQRFMRLVRAYKHGHVKNVSKEVKDAAESMTDEQINDFADKKAMLVQPRDLLIAGLGWLVSRR